MSENKFSEWVAEVSRNTPTSKTINSELSRASQLPHRKKIKKRVLSSLKNRGWAIFPIIPGWGHPGLIFNYYCSETGKQGANKQVAQGPPPGYTLGTENSRNGYQNRVQIWKNTRKSKEIPTFVGAAFGRPHNGWVILYFSLCFSIFGPYFGTHCGNLREFSVPRVYPGGYSGCCQHRATRGTHAKRPHH